MSSHHYKGVASDSEKPPFIQVDLGRRIKEFLPPTGGAAAKISQVQQVASYSWIDAKAPTIAVPGSPRVWKDANVTSVPKDSGVVFVDQNAYHMGSTASPLTPIFSAIDDFVGKYDFKSLDLVSDRNSFRKLFRWVTGTAGEFRIDVEVAGKTCLFTRRESRDTETIQGFRGFSHEYEKASTMLPPGCEKSTGHHRIISIDFEGSKILLRFTADASTKAGSSGSDIDIDDLAGAFSGLGVVSKATSSNVTGTSATTSPVSVIRTTPRTLLSRSSLIEVKTRAASRPFDWSEAYPQLYFSQTEHLYLAKHARGKFMAVEKHQLSGDSFKAHAQQAETGMGKLKALLVEVLDAAQMAGPGVGMSLICVNGRLELFERKKGTGKAVGKYILSKFVA